MKDKREGDQEVKGKSKILSSKQAKKGDHYGS